MSFAFIWDPGFTAYRFGPDHPFNPKRLELAVSLIEAAGLLQSPEISVLPPRPASDAELARVHSPEYIDAVKRLGSGAGSARDG
jgi:acetoin utilization protein AcuC